MNAWDTTLVQEFHASYSLDDHRSVVSLPRKGDITLPSNRTMLRDFHMLEQRWEGNVVLGRCITIICWTT